MLLNRGVPLYLQCLTWNRPWALRQAVSRFFPAETPLQKPRRKTHVPAADTADARDCQPEKSDVAFNSDFQRHVTSGFTVDLDNACDGEITGDADRVRRHVRFGNGQQLSVFVARCGQHRNTSQKKSSNPSPVVRRLLCKSNDKNKNNKQLEEKIGIHNGYVTALLGLVWFVLP